MTAVVKKGFSYPTVQSLSKEESEINILNSKIYLLPDDVLKKILRHLPYKAIFALRTVCRWFFHLSGSILNTAFLNLMDDVENRITHFEKSTNMKESTKIKCLRILNIVKCEVKVLYAVCLEWVNNNMWYFTGGGIIDHVHIILRSIKYENCSTLVSELIILNDNFLKNCDKYIEPNIISQSPYVPFSWFGRKFIDLLDCYSSFNQNITLIPDINRGVQYWKLKGNYEAKKVFTLKTPPKIENGIQKNDLSLEKILEYLRNLIRWNNVLNFQLLENIEKLNDDPKIYFSDPKMCYTKEIHGNECYSSESIVISFRLHCHGLLAPMKCRKFVTVTSDTTKTLDEEPITLNGDDYDFEANIKIISADGSHSKLVTYEITQSKNMCNLNTSITQKS